MRRLKACARRVSGVEGASSAQESEYTVALEVFCKKVRVFANLVVAL
ncbi:hypothetical protein [Candidatus Sarmatiella mevalonica]|nr:hypothetical protein [Candidatus Sarmatiella mevalonica]